MVSTFLLVFNAISLWGAVSRATITIGITFILMFHSLFFFSLLTRSKYLFIFFFFTFFYLPSVFCPNTKIHKTARSLSLSLSLSLSFSLSLYLTQSLVFWSVLGGSFVFQNLREFFGLHSLGRILICVFTIW